MAWSNQSKNSSTFANQNKNVSIWDMEGSDLLLMEDGYFLILEGLVGVLDRIILEQSSSISSAVWANQVKN